MQLTVACCMLGVADQPHPIPLALYTCMDIVDYSSIDVQCKSNTGKER